MEELIIHTKKEKEVRDITDEVRELVKKYHILSSLIGPSLAVPIEKGELVLGPWQKIVLVEFGGPRERTIAVNFIEEKHGRK